MKCAVLVLSVTLCAASATAFRGAASRRSRQYYSDASSAYQQSYEQEVPNQQSYQQVNYQHSGEVPKQTYQYSGEATPSYQYQPQYQSISNQYAPIPNSIETSYQQPYQPYQPQYYPDVTPTQDTPIQYGAPLAPYPPQFNVHQQAQYGQQHVYGPQQQQYGPLPGYTDLFGPTSAPGSTLITPTAVVTPAKTTTKSPTTQQPNNIFSLLLSLSQSSSGLSQPQTTKRPVATIATTLATAQPLPKAQIYSFANFPSSFQGQPVYYPQRRIFNPFSLQH